MNREEASFILANIDRRVCDDELNEALDMAIKALEQEPCEDAVSRQYLIDIATEDGAYDYVSAQEIANAPSVNPQPCDDAISRAEAVRVASGYCHPANVAKELAKLPPVNPTKTGHWIRWYEQKENDRCIEHIPHCKCSKCGKEYDPHSSLFIKYCNECGAKMIEPQERNNKECR